MATFTAISGSVPQYSTAANELASGYYLKFYKARTIIPLSVATDSSGDMLLAKVKLNDRGLPISNPLDNETIFIPYISEAYRIVLYKTEADADANDTADAVFNVDGLIPGIAPLADAADISLRGSTLAVLDDYDRSPLFINGDGFTAGSGPHVITVPSDWDPTASDFRVFRLDASEIFTPLDPAAVSSTDFTLAETLLSTDIIFIGDDGVRESIRIATKALAEAGVSNRDYMTPLRTQQHIDARKSDSFSSTDSTKIATSAAVNNLYSQRSDSISLNDSARLASSAAVNGLRLSLPVYSDQTVTLTNVGITNLSGKVRFIRIGSQVTMFFENLSHDTTNGAVLPFSALPAEFTPPVFADTRNVYHQDGPAIRSLRIDGFNDRIVWDYYSSDTGSTYDASATVPGYITWLI